MSEVAQKERRRKTRMKKATRNQVMMSCHIENGRHGRRSKKKKKASSKILIDSSDDSDSDHKRRSFRNSSKSESSKGKKKVEYHRVSHDHTFQLPSDHSASIYMGKLTFFDGTRYNQWKTKMFGYLNAFHKDL